MNARKMCAEQTFDWVQAKISRELFANQKILSEEDSVEVKWVFFGAETFYFDHHQKFDIRARPIAFSLSRFDKKKRKSSNG